MIKPAYSVFFLLSINIFVWQNVLYFPNDPRILRGEGDVILRFVCSDSFFFPPCDLDEVRHCPVSSVDAFRQLATFRHSAALAYLDIMRHNNHLYWPSL